MSIGWVYLACTLLGPVAAGWLGFTLSRARQRSSEGRAAAVTAPV